MDESTKTIVNQFADFLSKAFRERKEFRLVQVKGWSLKDFRLTVEIFIKDEVGKIYFDIREVKENKDRLFHLLGNAFDQVSEEIKKQEQKIVK